MDRGPARKLNAPEPGFWIIMCCRRCPDVASRIWWCNHEPGFPELKVDRLYLQGQIGLDLVDPAEVWQRRPIATLSEAQFNAKIQRLRWLEKHRPSDPEFNYRRSIDRRAVPLPRFEEITR